MPLTFATCKTENSTWYIIINCASRVSWTVYATSEKTIKSSKLFSFIILFRKARLYVLAAHMRRNQINHKSDIDINFQRTY